MGNDPLKIWTSTDLSGRPEHWMRGRPGFCVARRTACGGKIHPARQRVRRRVDAEKVRLSCQECQMMIEQLLCEGREESGDLFG